MVGPAIGGFLGGIDPRLPSWAAAVCSLANALYGTLVLPESLAPDRRKAFSFARVNPLGSLRLLRRHRELSGLAISTFMSVLASVCLQSTFVIYTIYRYGWDTRAVGLSLALVGISSAIARARVDRFGQRPQREIGETVRRDVVGDAFE